MIASVMSGDMEEYALPQALGKVEMPKMNVDKVINIYLFFILIFLFFYLFV